MHRPSEFMGKCRYWEFGPVPGTLSFLSAASTNFRLETRSIVEEGESLAHHEHHLAISLIFSYPTSISPNIRRIVQGDAGLDRRTKLQLFMKPLHFEAP
ncbi:hypothetical protein IAS59_006303 [Cryptococcus gattii]